MSQTKTPCPTSRAARSTASLLARLSGLAWRLAPTRCLLCDSPGFAVDVDLCSRCLADLPSQSRAPEFVDTTFPLLFCPWRYEYPVDLLIRALKFEGDRSVARVLGTLMARARKSLPQPLPDLLVPVPLHPRRLWERGYNQADEIAGFAAEALGIARARHALLRTRHTPAQSLLPGSARRHNLQGAFRATRRFEQLRVALVDDVITTGSTQRAAAAVLLAAGAISVEGWALASVRLTGQVQSADALRS